MWECLEWDEIWRNFASDLRFKIYAYVKFHKFGFVIWLFDCLGLAGMRALSMLAFIRKGKSKKGARKCSPFFASCVTYIFHSFFVYISLLSFDLFIQNDLRQLNVVSDINLTVVVQVAGQSTTGSLECSLCDL